MLDMRRFKIRSSNTGDGEQKKQLQMKQQNVDIVCTEGTSGVSEANLT